MAELTAKKIQDFFETMNKANADAWSAHSSFFEELSKRNTTCFTDLAKARMQSFKEVADAQTFAQAFEANLGFEEKVREDLQTLHETNSAAWEALTEQLQGLYAFDQKTQPTVKSRARKAKAKAKPKTKTRATKRKKATSSKTGA
jgi:hypothetical protein